MQHYFCTLFRIGKTEEVVGKSDYDLPVEKANSDSYREDDQQVMMSRQPKLNIEEKQVLHDGREIFLLTSKVPLFDKNNEVSGVLGIYSDITELKSAQEQLIRSKEKAEVASKAKSEFIANMSHDIRTPITGMVGMIQDLLNTIQQVKPTLEQGQQLSKNEWLKLTNHIENDSNILMDSTDQLLQICNEILEVTRLDGGIVEKLPEPFDLYELVQHNIELLTPIAHNKKLKLVADIDNNLPKNLEGLREYTSRILLNLLSNSLKFTKKGHVKLKVRLSPEYLMKYKKGNEVKIQFIIEDTGLGIPEDKFDVIFEHFSRLTPSYEGVYKGSGLGLYTVKRYVETMNGQIDLESKVGCGTCFTVTLPFIVSDKISKPRQSINYSKTKTQVLPTSSVKKSYSMLNHNELIPVDSAKAHILVVEDNAVAAMALTIALKPLHCEVDVAENGKIALNKATKNSYSLILMDVGLPDFSGIEVTKKIRALPDNKKSKVPIVAQTGHANNQKMVQECLDAGMQEVLAKPVSTSLLESIFKRYIFPQENQKKSNNKDKSIFDIDASAAIIGDEKTAWEMFDLLCQGLPSDVSEVKKAQKNGDIKMLRDLFHKLRGGLSFFKAPQLEDVTIELHDAVKTKPLSEIVVLFQNFYSAAEMLLTAYKKIKEKTDK